MRLIRNGWTWALVSLLGVAAAPAGAMQMCGAPATSVLNSVVRVSASNGVTASGVVVEPGLVLTAAHVIEPRTRVQVREADGAPRRATLLAADAANDLALLATDTHGLAAVDLASQSVALGERVWAAGYPRDGNLTISTGMLQAPSNGWLRTDAFVDSGQSGGALLRCGPRGYQLAGIVHGFLARADGDGYSNIGESLSVDSPTVRLFLAGARAASL